MLNQTFSLGPQTNGHKSCWRSKLEAGREKSLRATDGQSTDGLFQVF